MTTKTKEPADVLLLAARIAKAFPKMSAYSSAYHAQKLDALERAWHRHCEHCCSGEDGGYRKWSGNGWRYDPVAEERKDAKLREAIKSAIDAIDATSPGLGGIDYELQGDPRGRVMLLRFPGESEAT